MPTNCGTPAERPPESESFELADRGLGELAIDKALQTAAGDEQEMPDIADAFARMADDVGVGRRYDAVSFERPDGGGGRRVRIDATSLEALRAAAQRPATAKDDTLIGTLVEADFEAGTARLRGSDHTRTQVQFSPYLADEIQQALREPARLRGEVRYDPTTSEAARSCLNRSYAGPS